MSNINTVKSKALKSAKWMIFTSVFSMLFSYLSNILLGNISAETLGVYSAVNIFISSLTTFIGMGGAIVLSNFFPKTDSSEKRTGLLYTYITTSVAMYVVFVLTILLFPELNVLLSGGLEGAEKYIALFVMAPVFITMTVISYLLIALLEARISNIMTKLYTFFLPVVLFVVSLVDVKILENNLSLIIFLSVIVANLAAIVLGLFFVKKENVLAPTKHFYVPKGFYVFTLTTLLQAVFSFLYKNADKMFLISLGDMGQLGYYQAIISILTLVEFVPSLLGNVTIPYFSNIVRIGDKREVADSYERIEKYMLFFLVSCVLGVIALSDIALNMFGEGYIDYKYLLIILVVAKCVASLGFTNTPMMVVMEKNWIRLINSTLQIVIQFAVTFCTIDRLGILAVVLGRVIGVCLAQIAPQLVIKYKSGYDIRLSRAYFAGILCAGGFGILESIFDFGILISIAIGIASWLLFLLLGNFRKKDFISMFNLLLRR